jgi:tetratricopeptide (TPR) repeat protein
VRASAALLREQGVDVDVELALFQADHGEVAAALSAAQAAHARRPSIWVNDALAWTLHVAGRDAEALPYADQALRLGTRTAMSYYHRGAIHAALGHATQAKADVSTALAINPHFSTRHAPEAKRLLAGL